MVMESCEEMICQTCGSTGFSNALLKCTICKTAVEHQYCLEKRPTAIDIINWICRECKPKPPNTETKAKVSITLESLDFITNQPHSPGDKPTCHHVNGYHNAHDDLIELSRVRYENYSHSPGKQFETPMSRVLVANKSSLASSSTKDAATTSTTSNSTPSEGMFMFRSEPDLENGGTSAGSCGKPSDRGRYRRRRRILLPEEDQLNQVHGVNIIGDNSCRKRSNAKFLLQATGRTSTAEQGQQVCIEKKRKFAWSDEESESIITGQNSQKETLHANDNFLLQVAKHASTIGEDDAAEVPDRLQAVSARYRAEKVDLRKKRKLTKSNEDQSVEVHDKTIAHDASRESLLADKNMAMTIHHASIIQIDAPTEACNGFRMAPLERNHELFATHAQPIMHQIWRGCFAVCDQEYGPLVAHLSNKACERVHNTTRILPPVLQMLKLSRSEAWPKCFETSPPSDDNIALYFFAQNDRIEASVTELLDDVIKKDLMLKIVLDETELLVFSSIILPEDSQRFQGKYYLWGSFQRRQTGVTNVLAKSSTVESPWLKPLKGHWSECLFPKSFEKVIGQELPAPSVDVTPNSGTVLALYEGTLPEKVGVINSAFSKAKCRKMRGVAKKQIEYQVGDLVLVKLPCRQANDENSHGQRNCHYEGPFRVVKKVCKAAYKLNIPRTPQQCSIFHSNLLKLHYGNNGRDAPILFDLTKHCRYHQAKVTKNFIGEELEKGGISASRVAEPDSDGAEDVNLGWG